MPATASPDTIYRLLRDGATWPTWSRYELVSGLPLRDYHADVDLEPGGTGTTIHWHSSFVAKVPGTGWLYRRVLAGFIQRCAAGLADAVRDSTKITER